MLNCFIEKMIIQDPKKKGRILKNRADPKFLVSMIIAKIVR